MKFYTHSPCRRNPGIYKFLLVMKLVCILLCAALLQAHASVAQKVTISVKNAPLGQVLEEIGKQTGYEFLYNSHILDNVPNVDLQLQDIPLVEALDRCFHGLSFSYVIKEKTIVLTLKENTKEKPSPPGDINGRVTNKAGQPLSGATVTLKRTQEGMLTDANGNFTMRGALTSDTLIVSYLGYKRQYISIGDKKDFNVVMEETSNKLDEVVVQAYGETSQRLATGDIGHVSAAQIEKQPVMNPLEALQGQIAGVVVTNTSGYASGTVKVEIRGRNTINPNFPSDPLYIIDGVPLTILDLTSGGSSYANGSQGAIQSGLPSPANGQSPFFSINPADIESIEVLKDADATAIYGSRGANGVILITTKKGKAGKTHLNLNAYSGYSQVTEHYDMLNTQQYVAMREEALKNDGLPVDINNAPDLVAWGTSRYTDWQKYLWGGLGKDDDVESDISGGNEHTTFRIGAGYRYQTEILTRSGANQRGSVSFNINHKSDDQKFGLALTGNYSLVSSDMIFVPNVITLSPNAPAVFDNNGNLNYNGWSPLNAYYPFASLLQPYTTSTNALNSNLVLSYDFFKGLQFRTNLGYNNFLTTQTQTVPISSQDPTTNPTGQADFANTFVHNLIVEPQLEYNRLIAKGKLNILLGASAQDNSTSSNLLGGIGYTNDALLGSVNAAPTKIASNLLGEYKYEAVFARVNYNWDNKYIISFNGRRDGSTKFGPGRQFGNFGSAGASWIFSEENWIKNTIAFLSFGKLRASYGTTGGDQIGSYAYLSRWSFGNFPYGTILPLIPQGHSDSTLHWQVNRKLEAAIDLGFFKDRLVFEASYYNDKCGDQLIQFPTPAFTGFTSVTSNSIADVQNTGWEFSLNAKLVAKENFQWNLKFNVGINRNKLLSYPNLLQSPFADIFVVGQSLNTVKLLHYTGVDPQTGLYSFYDKNGDGQITVDQTDKTQDDRYTYDLSPKYDGGITTEFNYKNWQLSLFFYFKKQLGLNALATLDAPGDFTNQPVSVLNRWQAPGDVTNTARFTTSPGDSFTNYQVYSDARLTDASFIRLQNLSFSYTLPVTIAKKMGAGHIRFYVKGENLFVLTKYNGLDPEIQNFGGLPLPRIITGGLACTF